MTTSYHLLTSNSYPRGPEAGDGEPASLRYRADRLSSGFRRVWITGERFQEPPPSPVQAQIETDSAGRLLSIYQMPLCVLAPDVRQLFDDAGVDNIDYYPLEIHDEQSGRTIADHFAFNVVGAVAAADLARSRYDEVDGLKLFDEVVIKSSAAAGLRLFRLAESLDQIVVHDSVKRLADARGIDTLRFQPLSETS